MNKIILCYLLFVICYLFSSCYTLTQGTTYLGYLNKAIPLEKLTNEKNTKTGEEELNQNFVELVQDIRKFASDELGLAMTKNYTRYVKLDRNYLAAVVSASADDSFKRHEWKYPVVGIMPYKGFFKVDDARKEQAKLEKKGMDVWVRGVDAFSTLGWFKDPLFSYMRDYSPGRLAELIIHESVHATVFIKGQVKFNEELAEFIGREGGRQYMVSRFGMDSVEYQSMIDSEIDSRSFIAFIQELGAELNAMYEKNTSRSEKIIQKEKIIAAAKERFNDEYEELFSSENYRGFFDLPVNNAYIDLFRLYYEEESAIPDLFEKSGNDLTSFIKAAKTLPSKSRQLKGATPAERLAQALDR